jgi:outer membrane protein assembly factor BamE (lipoprotein component of BamABCDE complex)
MRSVVLGVASALLVAACATAGKISGVRIGMTKEEVVAVMGKPASVSAQGSAEYLNYALSETDDQAFVGVTVPYYVRLI